MDWFVDKSNYSDQTESEQTASSRSSESARDSNNNNAASAQENQVKKKHKSRLETDLFSFITLYYLVSNCYTCTCFNHLF